MKLKERLSDIASTALVWVLCILCLPLMLLILVGQFLYTPIDYIKFKKSRYQQDFPRKYSLWCGVHPDDGVYTIVKERDLPIEYIKWSDDYDLHGYFLYKDVLLDFTEPFFFDEKKGIWLYWPGNAEEEEPVEDDGADDDNTDDDNTDDCLMVDGAKECILESFRTNVEGRECHRVLIFYDRERAEKYYGAEAVKTMKALEGFVVYERGELLQAIRSVIDE